MTLSNLILFLLAAIGMTNIAIYGNFPLVKKLRDVVMNYDPEKTVPPRLLVRFENLCLRYMAAKDRFFDNAKEVFICPMCMGWWCGLVMALFLYPFGWLTFPLACASSFANVLTDKIQNWLDANSMVDLGGPDG
jgi:hypothetical protein